MKDLHKILVFSALFALFAWGPLLAEQPRIGEMEFKSHCAGCHGLDGKGNGPFVEFLTTKPRSITTLAKENQGVFPFQRIFRVIDGTQRIGAHGTKEMPIWGDRYAAEIIRQYGEFDAEHPQTVRCRIMELVFFLATMQE